jgi:flagellin
LEIDRRSEMPQIINTNIASINAQRQLDKSQKAGDQALQRLSSGLRINSAKDDAAGLAISNRFSAQIRGTSVASRNAGDGVSLAQTAEGALNSMQDSLQRIRELALQSANGSNTDLERSSLQEEVEQLKAEITAISEKTNFNGRNLLDGSFQDVTFQTGANVGETIGVSISKVTADTLGTSLTNGVSSNNISTGITAEQSITAGDLTINGIAVAAPAGTEDDSSFALKGSSAISKAAAINAVSEDTGVTATVNENTVEGTELTAAAAVAGEVLTLNGVNITIEMMGNDLEQDLTSVADAINAKQDATGVVASVVTTDGGFRIDLAAEDGRNITLNSATSNTNVFGMGAGVAATSTTYISDFTLVSEDGSDITLGTNTGNIDNFGFEAGTFSGSNSGVVGSNVDGVGLDAGDLTINGVSVGPTKASDDTASTANASGSAIAVAAAINGVSDQTGVTAKANANTAFVDVAANAAAFDFTINGVQVTGGGNNDQSLDYKAMIDQVNAVSGQTGVRAETTDANTLALVADDGRNIDIVTATAAGVTGFGGTTLSGNNYGSVSLASAGTIEVGSDTGGNEGAGLAVGKFGGGESGTLLKDIDISTVAGANAAIKGIDNAINQVSRAQAQLGAVQNRFEATISNLAVQGESLSAANSRIRDADFAAETAALSRAQVLQQAGISVLSQANAKPQQALSLLQ